MSSRVSMIALIHAHFFRDFKLFVGKPSEYCETCLESWSSNGVRQLLKRSPTPTKSESRERKPGQCLGKERYFSTGWRRSTTSSLLHARKYRHFQTLACEPTVKPSDMYQALSQMRCDKSTRRRPITGEMNRWHIGSSATWIVLRRFRSLASRIRVCRNCRRLPAEFNHEFRLPTSQNSGRLGRV